MFKKINVSKKGRKCKYHGCKQILSVYNHEAYCHVHADKPSQEKKIKVSKIH